MALAQPIEELLALIGDEGDRTALRAQFEKHEVLRERHAGYLRQSDYDRSMNENKELIAAGKNIKTWQKWYDENKGVPDRLNSKITELSTQNKNQEATISELRKQVADRPLGGEEVDEAALMAKVDARIAGLPGASPAQIQKIVTEELAKSVTAERQMFFEKTVPELVGLQAELTDVQNTHFRDFGELLDRKVLSDYMKEHQLNSPMVAYNQFIEPKRADKKLEAEREKIRVEEREKIQKELGLSAIPGTGASPVPQKGPLKLYLENAPKADPSSLPSSAGMREGSSAAAAELRAEGKS